MAKVYVLSLSSIMEKPCTFFLFLLLIPPLVSCLEKDVYIVYFGAHNDERALHEIEESHHSYLLSVKENEEDAKASLLYSYKNSINGFAALLTPEEASILSEREEVVSIFKSNPQKYTLQTTRSWEFAGVEKSVFSKTSDVDDILIKSRFGRDVIVGIVDNGVWPESKSFSDKAIDKYTLFFDKNTPPTFLFDDQ